jgi:hypothetical protein
VIDAADELFGLALEDFVAQRDTLAKALRAEGRREDADAVRKLRKPTAVVWAVNQVMRTQRAPARALIEAADNALKRPGDRDARRAHSDALDELARAAAGLLRGGGHGLSDDMLARVRSALHAASLDHELRDEFVAGRLQAEPGPAGLAALSAMSAQPKPRAAKAKPKPKPKAKAPPPQPRPSAAALKRVQRAETRVAKAREALASAEQELADARAALDA